MEKGTLNSDHGFLITDWFLNGEDNDKFSPINSSLVSSVCEAAKPIPNVSKGAREGLRRKEGGANTHGHSADCLPRDIKRSYRIGKERERERVHPHRVT